jgi:hypothetical protein
MFRFIDKRRSVLSWSVFFVSLLILIPNDLHANPVNWSGSATANIPGDTSSGAPAEISGRRNDRGQTDGGGGARPGDGQPGGAGTSSNEPDGGGGSEPPPGGNVSSTSDSGGGKSIERYIPFIIIGTAIVAILAKLSYDYKYSGSSSPTPEQPPNHELVNRLKNQGPKFDSSFNMSAFEIEGLVQADWPMVIEFEQAKPGLVNLTISAQGVSEIIVYKLSEGGAGRHRVILKGLPKLLGDRPRPAMIGLIATDISGESTAASFKLYGLGAGPRAIGSVAIDQVLFYPTDIRVRNGEKASYQFFAHRDFDHLSVDLMKLNWKPNGTENQCVCEQTINEGVRSNQWIGKPPQRRHWDGLDQQRQASLGNHRLHIRAWDFSGSWLVAWSEGIVNVFN